MWWFTNDFTLISHVFFSGPSVSGFTERRRWYVWHRRNNVIWRADCTFSGLRGKKNLQSRLVGHVLTIVTYVIQGTKIFATCSVLVSTTILSLGCKKKLWTFAILDPFVMLWNNQIKMLWWDEMVSVSLIIAVQKKTTIFSVLLFVDSSCLLEKSNKPCKNHA